MVAGIAVVLALPSAAMAQAYYFESTSTDKGPGMGRNGQVTQTRSYIDGANARIEFVEADRDGFFQQGGYLLTNDGGEVVYLVNPQDETYMSFNLDALFGMASSAMEAAGGIVDMEFENVSSEKLAEEPAGALLGYDTTRFEFQSQFSMRMAVLGFARTMTTETHSEIWCTDEIAASGFSVWLRPERFRTGNAEVDELIEQQNDMENCLPLKSIVTSTSGGGRGNGQTTTSEMIVTELREESGFPDATFSLPSHYTETSLLDGMPEDLELPEGFSFPGSATTNNSAGDADSVESDVPSDAEEEERPLGRLRNLLRR